MFVVVYDGLGEYFEEVVAQPGLHEIAGVCQPLVAELRDLHDHRVVRDERVLDLDAVNFESTRDLMAVAMATGINTRAGSRRLLEFAFENAVYGGSVPKEFIPAVEQGCEEASQSGELGGYRCELSLLRVAR